jgi:hypothetical protein
MKSHTPYIKKYLEKIEVAGYSVNKNGNQLHKRIDCYEIQVTDLTVRSLFMTKTVLVWVKNSETKIIEKERFFRHEILPLPFSKIDDFANTCVAELIRESKPVSASIERFAVKNNMCEKSSLSVRAENKIADMSIQDLSI